MPIMPISDQVDQGGEVPKHVLASAAVIVHGEISNGSPIGVPGSTCVLCYRGCCALLPGSRLRRRAVPLMSRRRCFSEGGWKVPGLDSRWEPLYRVSHIQSAYHTNLEIKRRQQNRTLAHSKPAFWQWEWQAQDKGCPHVARLNASSLCAAMVALGLQRIFIVGDSTQLQLVQSIWKLTGGRDDPGPQTNVCGSCPRQFAAFGVNRSIRCAGVGSNLWLRWVKDDQPLGTNRGISVPWGKGEGSSNRDIAFPWLKEYADSTLPTLVVAHLGLHFHEETTFRTAFHRMLNLTRPTLQRRKSDRFFFRTATPGHLNCTEAEEPMKSQLAASHAYTIASLFHWDAIPKSSNCRAGAEIREQQGHRTWSPFWLA